MKRAIRSIKLGTMMLGAVLLVGCGAAAPTVAGDTSTSSAASSATGATTTTEGPLNVIATTSILADLTTNVGGERVAVRTLLPAGTDPHTYAPSPADVQAVAESQLLIENGLGLEEWLQEVTENAGGARPTVTASAGLTPIEGAGEHSEEGHSEEGHSGADASATAEEGHSEEGHSDDPHMWFDVQNTIRYVENIRDGLKQADPAGASSYDRNAAAYIEQLQQLDAELVQQTATIPAERRKLATNHDTFGYFARRYGFEVVGTIFEGVSTEQEPSAQEIAALVSRIREQNVAAVFTENTANSRLAEQIASEVGVSVVTTLYTDALGQPGSDGETYIKMMRFNTQQIVEALK